MNRAARIADKATCGQVWCSASAWEAVASDASFPSNPWLDALSVGAFNLKGVAHSVDLMQCVRAGKPEALDDPVETVED